MKIWNCVIFDSSTFKMPDQLETGIRRHEMREHETKVYAIFFLLFSRKQAKVIITCWPVYR